MAIANWICRGCGGRVVLLDHFATSPCGESVVHPDMAAAMLADRNEQYVSRAVRVSHGLGCPRRAAIEESEPIAVDPLDANPMLTGTAWHALVESAAPRELAEVELFGTLAGVKVSGKCDRLRQLTDGTWAVEDWKHVNDFNVKYLRDGPKREHVVQLSLYAELAEQCGRPRPTVGIVWYHSTQSGRDALVPQRTALLPLDEALAHRPYDAEHTVGELLQQAAAHFVDGRDWRTLPLAGASIKFGARTGCDYCGVRGICRQAETGAPF